MLGVPATTAYDLNFRLLGIPVRIHPFFWAVAALLGWSNQDFSRILIWVACVFVSILVHEFGHGLTARALDGQRPSIVLYAMGGLCFYDREHSSPWRRLAILAMGPGAGFLLFILVSVIGSTVLGILPTAMFGIGPVELGLIHEPPRWVFSSPLILVTYFDLLAINLFWGIFNLLPIFPLDGGQMMHTLLSMRNRREGPRWSYIVSIGVAALVATYLYTHNQTPNAFLVAYLGLINFQLLQAARFQSRYDGENEDDWWRK